MAESRYFLIRAFEHLDREQAEIVCYSDCLNEDEVATRFRAASVTWHKCVGWSDERLAEQIRDDRIDILFDLAGHTAGTCEALWMGVPVVTCPGETFASRHSLSHLSNVGLTETIASNFDEYVELAVGLANDLERLATIRSRLRQQVAASPLCDGPRFSANLLVKLREVWRQWTESAAGEFLAAGEIPRRVPQ